MESPKNETGLSSAQAATRLAQDGPNASAGVGFRPLRSVLLKFWAPVPWFLEASIILELVLHKYFEAGIIGGLLVFNAALAYFQESHSQATLAALKSRLALNASVHRDGTWKTVLASQLVRGDLVKISLGGVVAADLHLIGGSVLLDQSMLTGESLPVEGAAGTDTFAGALVKRGEATGLVTATGIRSKFGRTAELVRTAHVTSSQEKAVLEIIRNLAYFDGLIILFIGLYSYHQALPWNQIIPLLLTAILAAIPVALPATFTLAAALGAQKLAKIGVLPTRLSAVDEAATIDVLCVDKTGTLTRNELSVTEVQPLTGLDVPHLLGLAALASAEGGLDSVDVAIRAASTQKPAANLPQLTSYRPFDPAVKTAEALTKDARGQVQRIVKGAFTAVTASCRHQPNSADLAQALENKGYRVLAVASGTPESMQLIGLIALSDQPRPDSASLISELNGLGVATVMVTGDAPATASIVAKEVGLTGAVDPAGPLPDHLDPQQFAIFAGVLPEGKYQLVKAFQKSGHSVGMCGDGANDAPALRQAQIGIAVSTATDVAKSAAGVVLTTAGLSGIIAAVKEGRSTFQRILTYTLNSVTKKILQVLFIGIGLLMTGHAVLTPLLMVILMITGDFLAMAITTDRVRPSPTPNTWFIGRITAAGILIGIAFLIFCTVILAIGKFTLRLDLGALQTLSMVSIAFGTQALIYTIRDRRHFCGLWPTNWMFASTAADISIITTLAVRGLAITPLPFLLVASVLGAAVIFGLTLSFIKIPLFSALKITS